MRDCWKGPDSIFPVVSSVNQTLQRNPTVPPEAGILQLAVNCTRNTEHLQTDPSINRKLSSYRASYPISSVKDTTLGESTIGDLHKQQTICISIQIN